MPITTPPPSGRRPYGLRRLRRGLATAAAAIAVLLAPHLAAAEVTHTSASADRQPLIAIGTGAVTGELPFCFTGASGPCGWIVEGTHVGSPIRSGTFWAAIDDHQAASPRRCVPATYSGLLHESPDDTIAQVGEGRICPDSYGGYVFTGRVDMNGVSGRFHEVSSGRGRVRVTILKGGTCTVTVTGHLRTT